MKYREGNDDNIPMAIGRIFRWLVSPKAVPMAGPALLARVFNHPARSEYRTINGLELKVKAFHLNQHALATLGIDPRNMRGGAEVYVLPQGDYEKYCRKIAADPRELAGVYAPSGSRELREIMAGSREILSYALRRIVVPEDVSLLTLCHEVLHDIYNSQNLDDPRGERNGFSRMVVEHLQREAWQHPGSAEMKFFSGVAKRCSIPYDLEKITEEAQVFIGEVFAYGGAMTIMARLAPKESETELGQVPEQLKVYFERTLVHSRLLG